MGQRDIQLASPDAGAPICLAPGACLSGGSASRAAVILTLGGSQIQLNRMAADILSLCDGSCDSEAIVTRIIAATAAPNLGPDVREFLRAALARGWIVQSG